MAAAPGIVSTQAHTILPATPHRTAEKRRVEPTPMIAPVMVWVVETGMPARVAPMSEVAPAVSALKPPTGFSFVIFDPIVWTMRQPPASGLCSMKGDVKKRLHPSRPSESFFDSQPHLSRRRD